MYVLWDFVALIYVLFTELRDGEDSPTTNKDHIYDNEIQISPSGLPFWNLPSFQPFILFNSILFT